MAEAKINVASAPPPVKPMTKEERSELYKRLREQMRRSPMEVKAPAGVTPYWARKNDDHELSRLDRLGFKIVHDDPANPRFKANGRRADGTYVIGDVILLEIPTEYYEFYFEESQERARAMVSGAREHIKDEAGRVNVPTFDVHKGKGE